MDSKTFYSNGDESLRPLAVREKQAADILGMSQSSLRRLTQAGEIPRIKQGRMVFYRVAVLEEWLTSRETYEGDGVA